jgi:hypothetical protein
MLIALALKMEAKRLDEQFRPYPGLHTHVSVLM